MATRVGSELVAWSKATFPHCWIQLAPMVVAYFDALKDDETVNRVDRFVICWHLAYQHYLMKKATP